jgi:hypothetical protein
MGILRFWWMVVKLSWLRTMRLTWQGLLELLRYASSKFLLITWPNRDNSVTNAKALSIFTLKQIHVGMSEHWALDSDSDGPPLLSMLPYCLCYTIYICYMYHVILTLLPHELTEDKCTYLFYHTPLHEKMRTDNVNISMQQNSKCMFYE